METLTKTFNPEAANAAQEKYCTENKMPHFAPKSNCYDCHQNIYEEKNHGTYKTGIPVEQAGRILITGCPHCHHTYCD